jgi:hypothetical protein
MDLNPGEQAVVASREIDSQSNHPLEFFEDDFVSDSGQRQQIRDITIPDFTQQVSLENTLLYVIRIGRQLERPTFEFMLKRHQCAAGM